MLPLGHMGITVAIVRVLESNFESPWVDYRLLLVGSLLPDLIDKPIRYLLSVYPIFIGKNYAHSLFLILILLIVALAEWYYRSNFMAVTLCIGAAIHDILDLVSHHEDWADRAFFNTTVLMAFEIIGGCMLLYFFIDLVSRNKVTNFIKTGER